MRLTGNLLWDSGLGETPRWVDASDLHRAEWQTLGGLEVVCSEAVQSKGRGPGIHTSKNYRFVVYPSNCHVIIICCDVGGGIHWRGTRAATPAAESRCLSYCQYPGDSLPQSTGRGSYKRSLGRPRPPMVVNQLTHPTLLVVRAPNRNQFITNKNKVKYGVASTMWLLRSTHLRKKQGEGGMEKPQQ